VSSKIILEVLLVRLSGCTPSTVFSDVEQTVRELLAPFRLGNRLFYEVALREGDMFLTFRVKRSAQMSLSLAEPDAGNGREDFEEEVHSISEHLRSLMESLYDQACGLLVTSYDLSTALEQARARGLLKAFCLRQGYDRTERIKLLFVDESPEDFQLVSTPGPTLTAEATYLTFEITSYEYFSARIKLVGTPPSGMPRTACISSVRWDRHASPGVGRFFFEAIENQRSVSASLHGLVKPNGNFGGYHLSAAAAAQMQAQATPVGLFSGAYGHPI